MPYFGGVTPYQTVGTHWPVVMSLGSHSLIQLEGDDHPPARLRGWSSQYSRRGVGTKTLHRFELMMSWHATYETDLSSLTRLREVAAVCIVYRVTIIRTFTRPTPRKLPDSLIFNYISPRPYSPCLFIPTPACDSARSPRAYFSLLFLQMLAPRRRYDIALRYVGS
ncbi:hypothetical protein EVAR_152_1 [Eumeta japonica]|uniref:Uncharacterized protein n=1 Tax=Eumeta variegata TaxID=151549 RepID=A0A4C1SBX3_EUMVA|nr:hypothetical protein EVAR_152_1 [Eumeta japonica]